MASIDGLTRASRRTRLGFDDVITRLERMNERSLDRLAAALRLLGRP